MDCVWNFFAASHAKSSCNGTCGTAKRLTASLQHLVTDQIFSAKDMLKFSDESINGIKFVHTLSATIVTVGSALVTRLTLAKKILEQGANTSLDHQQILQL